LVVQRLNCSTDFPIGLNDGQKVSIAEFTFNGVPAAHNELERDEKGRCKFMGYVVQFGGFSLYHSGDTLWYDGMEEILRPFHVDVAFLPINGNDPQRGVAGNLNASEAAQLGKKIGASYVIPHHYDMFSFNTADPADFASEAVKCSQDYVVLKQGQQWTLNTR
jgi:L-ascorbate metabolism protein UlaG (beta-lactamase superfamily)